MKLIAPRIIPARSFVFARQVQFHNVQSIRLQKSINQSVQTAGNAPAIVATVFSARQAPETDQQIFSIITENFNLYTEVLNYLIPKKCMSSHHLTLSSSHPLIFSFSLAMYRVPSAFFQPLQQIRDF
jgi:hypothetical protein